MRRAGVWWVESLIAGGPPPPVERAFVDLDRIAVPSRVILAGSAAAPPFPSDEAAAPGRPAEAAAPPDVRSRIEEALQQVEHEQARLAADLEERLAKVARREALLRADEARVELRQEMREGAEAIAAEFRRRSGLWARELGWLRLRLSLNEGWPDPDPESRSRPGFGADSIMRRRLAESAVIRSEIEAVEGGLRLDMRGAWEDWRSKSDSATEALEASVEEALRRALDEAAREAQEAAVRIVRGLGDFEGPQAIVLQEVEAAIGRTAAMPGLSRSRSMAVDSARSSSRRLLEARARIWVESQGWKWADSPDGASDRTEEFLNWGRFAPSP
jgi:hypothetical protein